MESVIFSDEYSEAKIGNNAFSFCSNLELIKIPRLVESIGDYAFHKCEKLKSVTFSNESTIKNIGFHAFSFCSNLESIKIPKLLKSIENSTFLKCKKLSLIIIPNFVKSIKDNAFFDSGLHFINFSNESSVKSIGIKVFSYCSSLESFSFPSSVEYIKQKTFYLCSELKSFIIPKNSSLSSIGECAFELCRKLQSFTLPKDINYIGDFAFNQCIELQKFYYFGIREPINFGNPFSECKKLERIYVTNLYLNYSFCGIKVKVID